MTHFEAASKDSLLNTVTYNCHTVKVSLTIANSNIDNSRQQLTDEFFSGTELPFTK